jgi:hypothetical protein
MDNFTDIYILRHRYQCRSCLDIVESNGSLVRCGCGALGIDAKPGSANNPRKVVGRLDNCASLCVYKNLKTGEIYEDEPANDLER